ncbi:MULTISPECIES: hypothetical protein [Sphingobacterium]|uniref:hypothetical protein n=1 Tax=Sphingobacterium TaxID=28453 RepID=UPI0008A3DCF4|nr:MULTISPECIES: hypothetical protein [Sphingobacterium]MBB1642687.1 hypothetical protein [Sphingobacterium sp. UME9]OFV09551.1 hypothetical protein HMPREF3127_23075 [Sphingobacterium sp. HMSC13C05]
MEKKKDPQRKAPPIKGRRVRVVKKKKKSKERKLPLGIIIIFWFLSILLVLAMFLKVKHFLDFHWNSPEIDIEKEQLK